MERRSDSRHPDHFEYQLTDKGRDRDLALAIVSLTNLGDRWAAPNGPPMLYVHSGCGGTIAQQTTCVGCGLVQPRRTTRTTGTRPACRHRHPHGLTTSGRPRLVRREFSPLHRGRLQ
jgi:hypothetical protein